ncbi:MAG: radical SAM protein [Nitrososphaerota archaeon]|nr:radical SAM protein [Nitrososphaerota archaeon]
MELQQEISKTLLRRTKSICPECNRILDAEVFERGDRVYIGKTCPVHGYFEDVYYGSYDVYKRFSKYARDGRGVSNPTTRAETVNCPANCGLCTNHLSHTGLANLVVTNRCDLNCWYCFFYAEKAGYVYEPSIEQIRRMARNMLGEKPTRGVAVQLTGGEPMVREDIVEIIKAVKEEGVTHVQLNSDGIILSQSPEKCKSVREAGVNTLYVSFDGVSPKTNPKNYWEFPSLLENCRRVGLGMVLVPTVINSVNDMEVWDMVRYAASNMDIVRGINFQPVSLVGRMPKAQRDKFRITIPDVIKKIDEQSGGQISVDDWFPVPASMPFSNFVEAWTGKTQYELSTHFACGAATYVFKDGATYVPISRFVDIDGMLKFLDDKADSIRSGKNKYLVGAEVLTGLNRYINRRKMPSGLNLGRMLFSALIRHDYSSLGQIQEKALFLGMMHFMDKYNYDAERVRRCDIHYLTPDDRIIPFCSYNVIPEWYRDRIQRRFSMSIEEWEKANGKTLKDGYYKRSSFAYKEGETLFDKMHEEKRLQTQVLEH